MTVIRRKNPLGEQIALRQLVRSFVRPAQDVRRHSTRPSRTLESRQK